MTDLIDRTFHSLSQQLPERVSLPGDDRYDSATRIWAKPVGAMRSSVVRMRTRLSDLSRRRKRFFPGSPDNFRFDRIDVYVMRVE